MKQIFFKKARGFTIFFAVLVASLALAIGLSIYDLTVRELDLSGVANQSQYAIYAADTGAECALYWDTKCSLGGCSTGSAFATSTETDGGTFPPVSGVLCNTQDVAANGTPPSPYGPPPTNWTAWDTSQKTASAATTTFTVTFSSQSYCATVTVAKNGTHTTVVSHGYNTCVSGGITRVERALQVSY